MGLMDRWNDYQPTKGVVAWAAVGASVLTMVIGFTVGGWVTGGAATAMSQEAAEASRAELAGSICFEQFLASESAHAEHQDFIALSSLRQRQTVERAEWAALPGGGELGRLGATHCATLIAGMDPDMLSLPVAAAPIEEDVETAIQ